jgi:hypothetical protein
MQDTINVVTPPIAVRPALAGYQVEILPGAIMAPPRLAHRHLLKVYNVLAVGQAIDPCHSNSWHLISS